MIPADEETKIYSDFEDFVNDDVIAPVLVCWKKILKNNVN